MLLEQPVEFVSRTDMTDQGAGSDQTDHRGQDQERKEVLVSHDARSWLSGLASSRAEPLPGRGLRVSS